MDLKLWVGSGRRATTEAQEFGIKGKAYHIEKEKAGAVLYVATFHFEKTGHHKYAILNYIPLYSYGDPVGVEPTAIKKHRVKIY